AASDTAARQWPCEVLTEVSGKHRPGFHKIVSSGIWLTFAPVADKTAAHFHISMDMVNWLSTVYLLLSIPFGLVATWVLDSIGLKCAVILCCLCALAQPLVIFSPTKLAALWFPDHQRATANTIASMSNPLGMLIANLLSPALVHEEREVPIMLLAYAVPAITACVLATVGVREKVPPTPPSASATHSVSQPFVTGLKMLMRNKAYIILAVSFGAGIAMFTCFSALLEQILCVKGYSNFFTGLIGALFIVFGLLGAFLLGLYIDKTRKFIEATKIGLAFAVLASIAFAVTSQFRNQTILLAIISSLFGFFGFATYPVAMELAVECSYPVGEGTSTGLIFVQMRKPFCSSLPFSTVSTLVMAGLVSMIICFYIIFFTTSYKRLHAEASIPPSVNKTEDEAVIPHA
uniref:Solute carrier family 49 member 3 n=1 Tax=Sphenodon punctatus TaxID=8508 RepID=A0A8D0L7B2_SPHPU